MRFEWDDRKNVQNIRKHGLDFSQGTQMFTGPAPLLIEPDVREDYSEERWIGLGMIGDTVAVVIFTCDATFNVVRIISLREADKDEQNGYYSQVFGQ
jgi:uncharacterized DUF497 family protein